MLGHILGICWDRSTLYGIQNDLVFGIANHALSLLITILHYFSGC